MIYLLILTKGRRIILKRRDPEVAKLRLAQLRDKYGHHNVFVYYSKAKYPDKSFKRKGAYAWCPYCHKGRYYIYSARRGINHCPVCLISEKDFHVQRANHLQRVTYLGRNSQGKMEFNTQQVKLPKRR